MRKILVLLLSCLLLSGCAEKPTPQVEVVTAVEVTRSLEGRTVRTTYTQPGKIRRFLYFLRQLETAGYATQNPERVEGGLFRVEVQLSDGSARVWRQRAERFVSVDCHRWKNMDEAWGRRLRGLLLIIPPDRVANPAPC